MQQIHLIDGEKERRGGKVFVCPFASRLPRSGKGPRRDEWGLVLEWG